MDPYNNLYDFIYLVHPKYKIPAYMKPLYDKIDQMSLNYPEAPCIDVNYSFADCKPCAAPCKAKKPWPENNKKEEIPMSSTAYASLAVNAETIEGGQRKYLNSRLYDIYETLKTKLKKQFGLQDDDQPATIKEALKRIQDGKFIVPEKYEDGSACDMGYRLRWRDPAIKEDKDGFKAAKAELVTAYTKALDAAALRDISEAEKIIADFEAFEAA